MRIVDSLGDNKIRKKMSKGGNTKGSIGINHALMLLM